MQRLTLRQPSKTIVGYLVVGIVSTLLAVALPVTALAITAGTCVDENGNPQPFVKQQDRFCDTTFNGCPAPYPCAWRYPENPQCPIGCGWAKTEDYMPGHYCRKPDNPGGDATYECPMCLKRYVCDKVVWYTDGECTQKCSVQECQVTYRTEPNLCRPQP